MFMNVPCNLQNGGKEDHGSLLAWPLHLTCSTFKSCSFGCELDRAISKTRIGRFKKAQAIDKHLLFISNNFQTQNTAERWPTKKR